MSKYYRNLKFDHDILSRPESVTGEELPDKLFHLRLDERQGKMRGLAIDVVDVPVADAVLPSWKLSANHGAMLGLQHGDDETGLGQIRGAQPCRDTAGEAARDRVFAEALAGVRGK